MKRVAILVSIVASAAAAAHAQNDLADPLQCWWRTSAAAVHVGQPFSVVLTCAVLETDAAKVVVDQSKLEPAVVQFAPFEVLGGSHGADLRTDDRRFFQYEYRLRLITENLFGKDVPLPETKISYHVQSTVSQGAAIQGRDQTYVLPSHAVRIVSLVPADASDIRDTTQETFADVDQRTFRANLLIVIGGVLFALAGLMALLAVVRLVGRFRKPAPERERLVGDFAVLRGVNRELSAVQRARNDTGWTGDLAGRALAALRILATYALGRKVARTVLAESSPRAQAAAPVGQLVLRSGWIAGKRVSVSGAVTPQAVAHEIARGALPASRIAMLETLEQGLSRFTAAQYGRVETALDDAALDDALAGAFRVVRRLLAQRLSPLDRFARWRRSLEVRGTAWSR